MPSFDLVFDTVGLVATLAVAALAAIRYREAREPIQLYQASAFLILAVANAVHVASLLYDADVAKGMPLMEQGQGPIWAFTIARLGGGVILAVGTAFYSHGRHPRFPAAVVVLPALVVGAATALAGVVGGPLPPLAIGVPDPSGGGGLGSSTPLGVLLGGAAAAMFVVAAALSRRRARETGRVGEAFLALGLVFAAFSQVGAVVDPAFAGVVSGADVLRLSFYVILLVGLTVETDRVVRALQEANDKLERLRATEVRNATLEERGRLARELHDGVAQDLWFAKLQANRLSALPSLTPEVGTLARSVSAAVENGLEQSRQAVMALRDGRQASVGFTELLDDLADSFEDRFGVVTRRSLATSPAWLGTRARAELLRIAEEAISNVGEHADATMAWLETELDDDDFRLEVRDNGRGFDPRRAGLDRFGIAGMRERAELTGAELTIESSVGGGTRVTVRVPRPGSAAATAGR